MVSQSLLVCRNVLTIGAAAALTVQASSEAVAVQLEALDLATVAADSPAGRNEKLSNAAHMKMRYA